MNLYTEYVHSSFQKVFESNKFLLWLLKQQVFPIFFINMSNRTFEAYEAVFNYIEKNVFELKAKLFMTDYEAALRKAINTCYRGVRLHGCWFHYDRAIQRYCLKCPKLREVLKINSNAKEIFKELLSLPLLPQINFEEGYNAVREKAIKRRVYFPMITLFRYFDSYWIRQVII